MLPAVERELLGHARHALALTAAVVFPYEFGGQLRQALSSAAPVVGEYLPARQSMQPDPAVENFPAAHTPHAALELAPASAPVPAAQASHVALEAAPTAAENVPAPQLAQVSIEEAPVSFEYLPALQSVQLAEPVAVLYLPAPQAEHAPPSSPV